jgi:protein-S-isoprenylcysteine O-methyltransferase Ste14
VSLLPWISQRGRILSRLTRGRPEEEQLLNDFFGDDYVKYRAKTRVGIPLIP